MVSPRLYAAADQSQFQTLARQATEARQADHLYEAIGYYQKAVRLHPGWSDGWFWLGSVDYDLDLYRDARDAFEHAIAGSKQPALTYAFLGLCDYEVRDYAAARTYLNKWLAGGAPGGAQLQNVARLRRAELQTQNGRFFEALYELNREVGERGPNPTLVEAMGLAWMQMKSLPEDYPLEKREIVWLAGSAAAWFSAGKQDRAAEYLDRLEKFYGDQPNVHFLRGFFLESVKDTDAAIKEYEQEVKISPQAVTPLMQLALLWAEAGKQEEALGPARQAVALEPANARSHFVLGQVLEDGQSWAESAAELEKAKELSPKAPKVHFHLAKVYRRLGRKQDSEHEQEIFQALDASERGEPAADDPASLRRGLEERHR